MVFLSVVEKVDPERPEMGTEATQQGSEDGVHTSNDVEVKNTEVVIGATQQAIDASGICTHGDANNTPTLLGNLKNLSETLKFVLDIIVEKIDAVAEANRHYLDNRLTWITILFTICTAPPICQYSLEDLLITVQGEFIYPSRSENNRTPIEGCTRPRNYG